jgi:hypothetical protein
MREKKFRVKSHLLQSLCYLQHTKEIKHNIEATTIEYRRQNNVFNIFRNLLFFLISNSTNLLYFFQYYNSDAECVFYESWLYDLFLTQN